MLPVLPARSSENYAVLMKSLLRLLAKYSYLRIAHAVCDANIVFKFLNCTCEFRQSICFSRRCKAFALLPWIDVTVNLGDLVLELCYDLRRAGGMVLPAWADDKHHGAEHHCAPDLQVGDKFYEFEGFIKSWKKRKSKNMIRHGVEQSPYIVIDNTKGGSDRFIRRSIVARNHNDAIKEVWLYEKGGLRLFFKNGKFR